MKKILIILIFIMAFSQVCFATTYYLSPSGGNWSDASTWASTSGGSDSVGVPDSTIDVVADPNSGSAVLTVSVDNTECKTINFTGFTGTFTINNAINFKVLGNVTLGSGMTFTESNGLFWFKGTQNITSNGKAFNIPVSRNGSGTTTFSDNFSCGTKTFYAYAGTLNTNGKSVTCGTFDTSVTYTRTVTFGNSTITCNSWNSATTTGLTFNYDTSTIIVNQSATGTMAFSHGNCQFYNLTLNGYSDKVSQKLFAGNLTVNNQLSLQGNSAVNRLWIRSDTIGVKRVLRAKSVDIDNCDFQDIMFDGEATWSGVSVGDCGGNEVNIVPIMTSNILPAGWVASASSEYDATLKPFKAFDKIYSTVLNAWASNGTLPSYIQLQFPTPKTVSSIGINCRNGGQQAPKDFTIQTSSNGTDWITQRTLTGETWAAFESKTYSLTTPVSCSYLRIAVTAVSITIYTGISELSIFTNDVSSVFTTPVDRFWVGNAGSWSNTAKWASVSGGAGGQSVPLCHDNVYFDPNSITSGSQIITADMPRMGKDIDFTGVANTPVLSFSHDSYIFGNLLSTSGITSTSEQKISFQSRSDFSVSPLSTYNGIYKFNNYGCTCNILNDFTVNGFYFEQGILNLNNKTITANWIQSNASYLRTINLTNSIINLSYASNTYDVFGITTPDASVITGNSTMVFNSNSALNKRFTGSSKTYNNLKFTGTSGAMVISGSNTFNILESDTTAGANIISLITATTTTLTKLFANTEPLKKLTLQSTTTTPAILTSSQDQFIRYTDPSYITFTGTGNWYFDASTGTQSNCTGLITTRNFSTFNTARNTFNPNLKLGGTTTSKY